MQCPTSLSVSKIGSDISIPLNCSNTANAPLFIVLQTELEIESYHVDSTNEEVIEYESMIIAGSKLPNIFIDTSIGFKKLNKSLAFKLVNGTENSSLTRQL